MVTRRKFLQWLAALGATAVAAPAYGFGIEPQLAPRITRYDLAPARWPVDLDLSIAILADIHACRPWMDQARIAAIVERTNGLNADLILLLGDYEAAHRFVTGRLAPEEWAEPLADLRAPLGVHAVLGNHDWWHDEAVQSAGKGPTRGERALEAVGIRVYENDAARITKEGRAFWLAGLGDQQAFLPSRHLRPGRRVGVDDMPGTLARVTDEAPVILMAHEPDIIMRVPDRVALTLSGHTHGGQVRLFGWSPVVPSYYGNRFAYGHVREPRDIVVSGGLGCSIMPVRFGVPPEIVLVKLGNVGA
jgi:hypothetical protein